MLSVKIQLFQSSKETQALQRALPDLKLDRIDNETLRRGDGVCEFHFYAR